MWLYVVTLVSERITRTRKHFETKMLFRMGKGVLFMLRIEKEGKLKNIKIIGFKGSDFEVCVW